MSEERAELSGAEMLDTGLPGTEPGDAQLPTGGLPATELQTPELQSPDLRDPDQGATEPPRTGLDPVDRVLAREAEIAELPVTQRAAAFEALHTELERILEERPGSLPSGLTGGAGMPGDAGQQGGPNEVGAHGHARSAR